jgi:adenylate kinase
VLALHPRQGYEYGEHDPGRVVRALQLASQELKPMPDGLQLPGQRRQLIHLDLPDSEVRRWVLNRRLSFNCGINYNLLDSTPAEPGRCDLCGGELVTREDDTEEALAVRLRDYHQKTNPVLDLFRRKEYIVTVDARPAPEAVQEQIRTCLGLPPHEGR